MKLFHIQGPGPYQTNTFLLADNGEAAVIDPAANESLYTDLLLKEGLKLKYVLLTHGHHDHIASAKALCEKNEANLIMHADDDAQFKLEAQQHYTDRSPIYIGQASVTPYFTPGHTRGSVCLLCGDVLFSGDTLFDGDVGRTDLEGGNEKSLCESLKMLANEIANETQVLPGHGGFSSIEREKAQNPYLKAAL